MTTFVAGLLRRRVGPESFVDITDAPVTSFAGGITFDGELTAEQVARVVARIDSTDDDDQAARAHLRGLVAADDPGLCAALVRYVLGDPIPEPPQT